MHGDGGGRSVVGETWQEGEGLRSLLDAVETQVAALDSQSRYRYVNLSYANRVGRARDQIVGRPCREVLSPEAYSTLAPHLDQARAGHPVRCRVQLPRPDGTPGTYQGQYLPLVRDGRNDGCFELLQDVTEHHRTREERDLLEERLAQAQRMEALGTLAGGIAHDFNNILGIVMGYTELSLLKLGEATPVKPHLDEVLKATDRAKQVVRQILAFSRTAEQQRQPVAVMPLVKEILKLLRATLPATIEIDEDLDPATSQVVADPSHLHQVVMNLCTNAYQAMRERGGHLTVGLGDVQLAAPGAQAEQGLVQLTVSDTGCGMPARVRRRAFEPYFTTRPTGEGSGMGLAVVHGIVTSLGGWVVVDSVPDRGTTFRVYLPARVREDAGVREAVPVATGTGQHVLFVDDEVALAELGKEMLGVLGYRATAATSSVEALELFRADPDRIDCVVTDQTLPRMTGAELIAALLQVRPNLPVILCTGYSEFVDEQGARNLGAREFLPKPLDLRCLAAAVAAALAPPPAAQPEAAS